MKKILLLTILIFITPLGFSQSGTCIFSGTVQNKNGEPIPYSSIYFPALATGKMTNMEGKYKIDLPCGKYKIKVQCLGYETALLDIDASSNKEKTIILSSKTFAIREVTVNASAEDPAYNVMRKAVVMAKYYKKQIREYDCNIYVRSFYTVDNIPGLAKLFAEEKDLTDMKAGNISETLLKYSYKYPNTVSEKIISTRNGRGDTAKTGSSYINLSFYNIGGTEIISPLSRSAFQVYKFELIGTYVEDGKIVNKIKIIPKRKGNDLMRGFIYINDLSWNINRVDVKFKLQVAELEYKQLYSEIYENAWMPISHEIKVKASLMGFKGHYKYIASLSNIKIKTDPSIDEKIKSLVKLPMTEEEKEIVETTVTVPAKKQSKTVQKINELMDKEELTRSETLKLVRLVNKENKQEQEEPPSLEVTRDHKTEYADSAFNNNDSVWEKIREVPLSSEETTIYTVRDSLIRIENGDTVINKKRGVLGNILFFNGTLKSTNKKSKLKIPGLLARASLNFNTVDGFIIKKTLFSYQRDFEKGKYIFFEPSLQYAFAREDLMGQFDFNTQYNMVKRARFYFSVGKINSDFNTEEPMHKLFNSVSTLFFTENYKKLYQKEYLNAGHSFDIKNGMNLNTSIEYADRTQLYNNTDFRIIKRSDKVYTANTPILNGSDTAIAIFGDHKSTNVSATFSYTPKQFYRFKQNNKQMLYSAYPTFDLKYKQGLSNVFEGQTDFSFLEVGIHQSTKFNVIDKVNYHVGGGKFISKKALYFADYKSFNTQPFYIVGSSDVNSFKLLGFYENNVSDYFVEGHFSIEDNVLFLKHLPLLNTTNLTEEFYVNYLYTDLKEHYYEFGYSLNKLFFLFDVEAFVSFINNEYNAVGVKLSLNFIGNNSFNE